MSHKNQKIQRILENKEGQRQALKEKKLVIQEQRLKVQQEQQVQQELKHKQEPKTTDKPKSKWELKYDSKAVDKDCLSAFIIPSETSHK